jgi:hypothetical protein
VELQLQILQNAGERDKGNINDAQFPQPVGDF